MGRKKGKRTQAKAAPKPTPPPPAPNTPIWRWIILLTALSAAAVLAFTVGWAKSSIWFIIGGALLLFLALAILTLAAAFKKFRDSYPDFLRLIVPLGILVIGGVAGAIGFSSQLTDRDQVKQLLESARADADNARIAAETFVIFARQKGADTQLSDQFHRNKFPLPERLLKITSELLVVRNIFPETLSAISANVRNMNSLGHAINEEQQSDSNLKQSVVLYVDSLALFDVLFLSEIKHLDGEISDPQMHKFHQELIFDSANLMNPEFVEKAFANTPLITRRRMSASEAAFKSITGHAP